MTVMLNRCELCLPADNRRMAEKAATLDVDGVVLDLEDAVAPSAKAEARQQAVHALTNLNWGYRTRAVRINALDTPWAYEDIIEIAERAYASLDVIVMPKPKTPADVLFVDTLLKQIEMKLGVAPKVRLEVMIEEVEALINVNEIAACSPRIRALTLGMGDLAASQGMRSKDPRIEEVLPGGLWQYHRNRVAGAARAAGIEAIDGPFGRFTDPEAYRTECTRAYLAGFSGKWAIHPSQIEIAEAVFTPPVDEIDRARRMAKAYAEAHAQGLGAITFEGTLVDVASVRMVQHLLDFGDLLDARRAGAGA